MMPMGQKRTIYLFVIRVQKRFSICNPQKLTDEGILDWKKIDWINDFDNLGVAHNIPYFLKTIIEENRNYRFKCEFEGNRLSSSDKGRNCMIYYISELESS